MPLRAQCPAGHKLIVPDDRAGQRLRCPRCDAAFTVPGERVQNEARQQQAAVSKPVPPTERQAATAVAPPMERVSTAPPKSTDHTQLHADRDKPIIQPKPAAPTPPPDLLD